MSVTAQIDLDMCNDSATLIRYGREKQGYSRSVGAEELNVGVRTLAAYELGEAQAPPSIKVQAAKKFNMPKLENVCCLECDAGKDMYLPLLNNINNDIANVRGALREELQEALDAMDKLDKLMRNAKCEEDLKLSQISEYDKCLEQIYYDTTRALQELRHSLLSNNFTLDRAKERHVDKCIRASYHITTEPIKIKNRPSFAAANGQ